MVTRAAVARAADVLKIPAGELEAELVASENIGVVDKPVEGLEDAYDVIEIIGDYACNHEYEFRSSVGGHVVYRCVMCTHEVVR